MKTFLKISLSVIIIFALILGGIYFWISSGNQEAENINFQKQLGTYILDTNKTALAAYSDKIYIYKNLQITFKSDGTCYMNMKVPFFYDSVGRWNAAGSGLEDWNWIYYKGWDYLKYKRNTGNQFTSPWTKDSSPPWVAPLRSSPPPGSSTSGVY